MTKLLAVRLAVGLGLSLAACPAPPDATKKEVDPAGPAPNVQASAPPSAEWSVRTGPQGVAEHRGGARLFAYAGPADLDRGLPGIVEGRGRGPAYGLLSGYFAPRILAVGSSTTTHIVAAGPAVRFALPGLAAAARSPTDRRIALALAGGATFTFPADRTEVQGLLRGQPSFAVNVSSGAPPGYRSWRADQVLVQSRAGARFSLRLDCHRVLLIHPVPKGSTSVFLLHVGPKPPPSTDLYMPPVAPPADVVQDQRACSSTGTSTLTVVLP